MADVEKFAKSPSHVSLNNCTKEQLVRIAEFYEIQINDKRFFKSTIKIELKISCWKKVFYQLKWSTLKTCRHKAYLLQSVLTFDQQKSCFIANGS